MLFTLVIEHEGATTVEQVRSRDVLDAILAWNAKSMLRPGIPKETLLSDPPTPLEELTNAWCMTAIGKHDSFFLINIVATVEEKRTPPLAST